MNGLNIHYIRALMIKSSLEIPQRHTQRYALLIYYTIKLKIKINQYKPTPCQYDTQTHLIKS
jgi:hypothetical protein